MKKKLNFVLICTCNFLTEFHDDHKRALAQLHNKQTDTKLNT